jgi:hypothetical protein
MAKFVEQRKGLLTALALSDLSDGEKRKGREGRKGREEEKGKGGPRKGLSGPGFSHINEWRSTS